MQKVVSDYPGYIIFSDGRLFSEKNNRFLKARKDKKGYLCYRLTKNNVTKEYKAHRLVAEAFILNINNLPQVNHIDEDKTNNDMSNLEWCDGKYNMNYGSRKNCKAKAVEQIDIKTGKVVNSFISAIGAARELNIDQGGISMCARNECNTYKGYRWRYVSDAI